MTAALPSHDDDTCDPVAAATAGATPFDRALLDVVLAQLPVAVLVAEAPSGRLVYENEAAARLLRRPPTPATNGNGSDDAELEGYHRDGRRYEPHEWPLARALEGEDVAREEIEIVRGDGARRTVIAGARPIRDAAGQVIAAVATFDDISDRVHVERLAPHQAGQFAAPGEDAPELIVRYDRDLRHTFINAAVERLLAIPAGALLGKTSEELGVPEDPEQRAAWQRALRQVFATGQEGAVDLALATPSGRLDLQVRLLPECDAGGTIQSVLAIGHDTTDLVRTGEMLQRAESAHQFLAEVSERLAGSLDIDETLAAIAGAAVPFLGDYCRIDVLPGPESPPQTWIVHADPATQELLRETARLYPFDAVQHQRTRAVLETGHAIFNGEVTTEALRQMARSEDNLQRLLAADFHWVIVTPLTHSGRHIGLVTIGRSRGQPRFRPEDLALAQELSHRAALAVENARLFEASRVAEEQVRRQAVHLQATADVAKSLAEARLDTQAILQTFAERVAELIGDGCAIRLLADADTGDLTAAHHRDPAAAEMVRAIVADAARSAGDGPMARALCDGETVLIPAVPADFHTGEASRPLLPYLERFGESSILATPLRARGRIIGAVRLTRGSRGRPYSGDDRQLLEDLAERAALAVDNARLYAEAQRAEDSTRRLAERQQALADASHAFAEASTDLQSLFEVVARLAAQSIGQASILRLLEDDARLLVTVARHHRDPERQREIAEHPFTQTRPSDVGATGWVVRTGRPVMLTPHNEGAIDEDLRPVWRRCIVDIGLSGVLVVPMRAQGRVIGTLGVWRDTDPRAYRDDDLSLLQDLGDRAALAIDNARLFAREREARSSAEVAERTLLFLAEASDLLSASLDFEATLARLAHLSVPILADMCLVDTLDGERRLRRLGLAHAVPEKELLLHEMAAAYPPEPDSAHPAYEVVRTREPNYIPDVSDALLAAIAHDERHLQIMKQLDIRSGMTVPLLARGRTLGAIEFLRDSHRPPFTPDDLAVAMELARRAAVAVDNARLYNDAQRAEVAAQRHARRLQALVEVSRSLAEVSLDFQAVLDTITTWVARAIGDVCVTRLIAEDGSQLVPVSIHHPDPEALALLREVLLEQPYAVGEGINGRVAATGEPILLAQSSPDVLQAMSPSAYQRYEERYPTTSLLVAPMRVRREVIGTVSVSRFTTDTPYTVDDQDFLMAFANRAALAVANARLHHEIQTAETRYRTLFEGSPDAIVLAEPQGRIIDANPAAVELFGYSLEELLTLAAGDLAAGGEAAQSEWVRWRQGTGHGEFDARRRDGTHVPVEVWVREVQLPGGAAYLANFRDISERRYLERMQREFVAMVTHELKAPLTSLKGFAQLMQRREAYNPRAVKVIINQSDHLDRLITDLLDVARLDAGRLVLRRRRIDLVERVLACAERAQEWSELHRVQADVPAGPVDGWWDPDRVDQILQNLLSNAIKYSPDGGLIVVRIIDLGDEAAVAVSDQGSGIAPEVLPQLFERFFRVDGPSGNVQGLGLGLYISRSLVEAHGGRIWAESTVGEGSTFTFTLPRGIPPEANDASLR